MYLQLAELLRSHFRNCKLVEEGNACYSEKQLMFISEFLSDVNFGLASFTMVVYSMTNYCNRKDHFTNSDGDRSNWFETILQYREW